MRAAIAGLAVALGGCGDARAPDPAVDPDPPPAPAAADDAGTLVALVSTADALYRVAPGSLDVTRLGAFSFPDGAPDRITDIAVDRRGRMWATGFEAIYAVDPRTLACTLLARHPGHQLNALAVVTSAMWTRQREVPDLLIAAEAHTSAVYLVDGTTGALTEIGDLGGGLVSSGDLTWAPGVGAIMVTTDRAGYEGISRLAPDTFAATPIGAGWSFQRVRALTLLPDGVYGADEAGDLLAIDTATGAARLGRTHPLVFYGGAIRREPAAPHP